jgi:hypothetical protein
MEIDINKVCISTHDLKKGWDVVARTVLQDKFDVSQNLLDALHKLRMIEIMGTVDKESINKFLEKFEK